MFRLFSCYCKIHCNFSIFWSVLSLLGWDMLLNQTLLWNVISSNNTIKCGSMSYGIVKFVSSHSIVKSGIRSHGIMEFVSSHNIVKCGSGSYSIVKFVTQYCKMWYEVSRFYELILTVVKYNIRFYGNVKCISSQYCKIWHQVSRCCEMW